MRSNTSVLSCQCHALTSTLCCSQNEVWRAYSDEYVTFVCYIVYNIVIALNAIIFKKSFALCSPNIFLLHINKHMCLQRPFTDWVRSLCCLSVLACVSLVTVGVTLVTNCSFIHCTCPNNEDTVNVTAFRHITPPCLDIPPSQSHVLHTHIPLSIAPPRPPNTPHTVHASGRNPSVYRKKPNGRPFRSPLSLFFTVWVDQMNIPCHRA